MSAAKDEAEDGPDSSGDDDTLEAEVSENVASDQSQEDELFTPTRRKPNGPRGYNSAEDHAHVEVFDNTSRTKEYESASPRPGVDSGEERPSSADGSLSIPDDTPSVQGSIVSSSPGRGGRLSNYGRSPTPSLRPFDRRFQARGSPSPLSSPRASSPILANLHSRKSSATIYDVSGTETPEAPWEVVRWTKLRKMTGQAFSEIGKRNFGRPTSIAIAASILLGTSKGIILVFDYNQNLKSIIGMGTKAVESGSITSMSISADHSSIAAGHASGNIFTWEIAKTAKPFLHIPPNDRSRNPNMDGHVQGVAILHIGFLGMRHTALASADDHGMAFSHLATRGMGLVSRSVKTTRILGRYPDKLTSVVRQRKPSSVMSFSSLPFSNVEYTADSMGLVALLTPYLLVVVSTTPVAQTQYKAPRPKEVAAHGAMTAALAWFPSVKLKTKDPVNSELTSRAKLVYCWSNILTVLEIVEVRPTTDNGKDESSNLQFRPRSRWKAEEAIVGVQWLGRSVLAVLTITQQLVIIEDPSMSVTDSSDLIQKHIYHTDLFSPQLNQLVDQLEDEENAAMHGVVADAFYMSFRAYKGRLFLLGHNEISFGTLSNWADRLLALMEEGGYIEAIRLATSYYTGDSDKIAIGLAEDDGLRHTTVQAKLLEMISASLKYSFGKSNEATEIRVDRHQLESLASACIAACIEMEEDDVLFDEVYVYYQESGLGDIYIASLEPFIVDDDITNVPPTVIKDLVAYYTGKESNTLLEEIICHLDPHTIDIDQITILCKKNHLYDALLYVWNQAIGDYTTILNDLLSLSGRLYNSPERDAKHDEVEFASASKIFPYLSYILTGRIYPTGKALPDDAAILAKAEIYNFLFSGSAVDGLSKSLMSIHPPTPKPNTNFPNLRRILSFDAPSFLSMLNEAFEDSFLNGSPDRLSDETPGQMSEDKKFGLSVNRQWIVSILLEVMTPPNYESDDTIYLDMFIARNLPKFPQFILLPGHVLHRVLVGLCQYPSEDVAEDCQLSIEYLLSLYQPPDLSSLIPMIAKAHFYRVLKSIYKSEKQYANLLRVCFEDFENSDAIFDCISDCLRPGAGLNESQKTDVRAVIIDCAHDLAAADIKRAANTIDHYASDLHQTILDTLDEDENAQYQYLQTILEPADVAETERQNRHRGFVGQYVRLLCDYNPSHVSEYIENLEKDDLRLEEVLPALEDSGVIDAAVVLMAREGKAQQGIDRLTQHLYTLESALIGLLDGIDESPDVANTMEAGHDLVTSLQKYARVGVWLCQRQTKAIEKTKPRLSRAKSAKFSDDTLSADERSWLDVVDAVVTVTKDVTGVIERHERQAVTDNEGSTTKTSSILPPHFNLSSVTIILRTTVQETFTALLTATSTPPASTETIIKESPTHHTNLSFLHIFRAFLKRASLSSPTLSNLRSVITTIFSAYAYEENLLSLANQMLDKDLFVHVAEADALRRKGWRPKGQTCEGCGVRVWGPGAQGAEAWQAWYDENNKGGRGERREAASRSHSKDGTVKGKQVSRDEGPGSNGDAIGPNGKGKGAVMVFSCRHLFHRICLQKMRDEDGPAGGEVLVCPLCI